ncbi:MAG: hypothetical protein ACP5O7_12580 [Phycisphaerae bacterium]
MIKTLVNGGSEFLEVRVVAGVERCFLDEFPEPFDQIAHDSKTWKSLRGPNRFENIGLPFVKTDEISGLSTLFLPLRFVGRTSSWQALRELYKQAKLLLTATPWACYNT